MCPNNQPINPTMQLLKNWRCQLLQRFLCYAMQVHILNYRYEFTTLTFAFNLYECELFYDLFLVSIY